MTKIGLSIFVISLILYVACITILFIKNNEEKKYLELKVLSLEAAIEVFEEYKAVLKSNINNNVIINDDIKEAVKYAMKKSHPDNNGNAEDFDKFRKLYERIK